MEEIMRRKGKYLITICSILLLLGGCNNSSAGSNYSKAIKAYEKGDYEAAETLFVKAIDKDDDKAEYHLDYAFNLIQLNKYEEAMKEFDRVIMDKDITMVKENNKQAYRGKGIAYLQMNDNENALAMFNKALAIKERNDLNNDILYYKAKTLENTEKLEDAIQIYSDILASDNKNASIYSARANIYRQLSDFEASIADYDMAIKYAPEDFNVFFGKFFSLKDEGKEEEALAVLEQAATIKIVSEEDKFNLAKVHFYQENYETALNELITSLSDGFTEANYYLGEISLVNGDYKSALDYYLAYEKAGNSINAIYYNQLMVCYLNLSDYENAKTSLSKAKTYSTVAIKEQLMKNEIILLEKTSDFSGALKIMEEYATTYTMDEETKKDYEFLKTRVNTATKETNNENSEDNSTKNNGEENSEGTTVNKP